MPAIGERKTKGGLTGEWDGTTWRRVAGPPDVAAPRSEASDAPGPQVGDRKTKGGVVGEWDGTTWRRVDDGAAPAEERRGPQTSVGDVGTGLAAVGLAAEAAKPVLRMAGRAVASSPNARRAIAQVITGGVGAAVGGWPGAFIGREAAALVKPAVTAAASRLASVVPSVALRVGSVPVALLHAMVAQPGGNPVSADERAQSQQSAEIEYRRISGKDPRTGQPIRRQDTHLPLERR